MPPLLGNISPPIKVAAKSSNTVTPMMNLGNNVSSGVYSSNRLRQCDRAPTVLADVKESLEATEDQEDLFKCSAIVLLG